MNQLRNLKQRNIYNSSQLAQRLLSQGLDADLAPGDTLAHVARLEGLLLRRDKLFVALNGGEPEAVLVGKVVAGAAGAVALDEGSGTEVLQAGARGGQGLAAAAGAGRRVHGE